MPQYKQFIASPSSYKSKKLTGWVSLTPPRQESKNPLSLSEGFYVLMVFLQWGP